jgi:hypothetical protein
MIQYEIRKLHPDGPNFLSVNISKRNKLSRAILKNIKSRLVDIKIEFKVRN